MQEVDREDLRELLASQSGFQDQPASTGIKMFFVFFLHFALFYI